MYGTTQANIVLSISSLGKIIVDEDTMNNATKNVGWCISGYKNVQQTEFPHDRAMQEEFLVTLNYML